MSKIKTRETYFQPGTNIRVIKQTHADYPAFMERTVLVGKDFVEAPSWPDLFQRWMKRYER